VAIRNSVWISLSACKEESKTDIKKTAWQQYSTQSTTYQTKRDKSCTYCIISATFFSPFTYKHTHTDERKHLNQIKLDFVMINKQFRPKWAYLSYSLLFYMEITPICLMAKLYPNFKKMPPPKTHHPSPPRSVNNDSKKLQKKNPVTRKPGPPLTFFWRHEKTIRKK